jgi:hypothetical protein
VMSFPRKTASARLTPRYDHSNIPAGDLVW